MIRYSRSLEDVLTQAAFFNQKCLIRPTLFDLFREELCYPSFVTILYRFNGSCNTTDDFSDKISPK